MNKTDMQFGSRSGVQKALRRGDINLAKTCFDLLWETQEHKNWLKWRMSILVEEDAWNMIGELPKLFSKHEDEESAYRKFFYRAVLGLKSKDTEGLMYAAMNPLAESDHPEFQYVRLILEDLKDPVRAAMKVKADMEDGRKLSPYEKAAMTAMQARTSMGGMFGDRQACVVAMVLIGMRGLDEAEVQKVQDEYFKKLLTEKPKTITLPWYIFDFHTALGKIALSIFMKRKAKSFNLTEEQMRNIWFMCESGMVPNDQIRYTAQKEKPTCFDTMWWPVNVKLNLTLDSKRTPKVTKELWENELRKEMRGIISWLMERRT